MFSMSNTDNTYAVPAFLRGDGGFNTAIFLKKNVFKKGTEIIKTLPWLTKRRPERGGVWAVWEFCFAYCSGAG